MSNRTPEMVYMLVSFGGMENFPYTKWTPHKQETIPPKFSLITISLNIIHHYPSRPLRNLFEISPTATAIDLYLMLQKLPYEYGTISFTCQLEWNSTVIFPGKQTLHQMGFVNSREIVKAHVEEPVSPYVVWALKGTPPIDKWTPKTHLKFPKCVRDSVTSLLLVAKHQLWNAPQFIMHKIIGYVCIGWARSD